VDRDAFRQKQKNPFQEKVIISISRGKRGLQSGKTFSQIKNGASRSVLDWHCRALPILGSNLTLHDAISTCRFELAS
jgi:hypothetical protein